MIYLVRDALFESPAAGMIQQLFKGCVIGNYGEIPDAKLLQYGAEVIVLAHDNAIEHCAAITKTAGRKRNFKIIVILPEDKLDKAVAARAAGADRCIVEPASENYVRQALKNSLDEVIRFRTIKKTLSSLEPFGTFFEAKDVIATGCHGTIFAAVDKRNKADVSIKLLSEKYIEEPELVKEFADRAAVYEKIKSTYIPETLATGVKNGAPFIVTKLPTISNMYTFMAENARIAEYEIVRMGQSVVRALIEMKKAGFVHVDIKPENVLYYGKRFYLTDFGLLTPEENPIDETGNPFWCDCAFTAPEMFTDDGVITARSDVFSLGLIMYTLSTGVNPLAGRPFPDSLLKGFSQPIKFPDDTDARFSPLFRSTVEAMLGFKEEQRPRLRDLEAIFTQMLALAGKITAMSIDVAQEEEPAPKYVNSPEESIDLSSSAPKIQLSGVKKRLPFKENVSEIKNFSGSHRHFVSGLFLIAFVLILLAFVCGLLYPDGRAYVRGTKKMFTCPAGHTEAVRTLDAETIACNVCGETATLSYTCQGCNRVYGIAQWPERDMTDEECTVFEEKLSVCPFCASDKVAPTPVPSRNSRKFLTE